MESTGLNINVHGWWLDGLYICLPLRLNRPVNSIITDAEKPRLTAINQAQAVWRD
jgi:hypothetical protein